MILVDREIKNQVEKGQLIKEGYNPDHLNSMSYDLTLETILIDKQEEEDLLTTKEVSNYVMSPGEYVYIKTKETLTIPLNILGRIAEKNSVMRMGLVVAGPHYQPGHTTKAFLRVQNISPHTIAIAEGKKIAQIIFEQLSSEPEIPYSEDRRASFNEEFTYKGFGKYKDDYERKIEKLNTINNDIENKVNNIYANILTLMGIFVSVFSLITVNFSLFSTVDFSLKQLIKCVVVVNTSLGLVITFILGIIAIILNKVKSKALITGYFVVLGLLIICNMLLIGLK